MLPLIFPDLERYHRSWQTDSWQNDIFWRDVRKSHDNNTEAHNRGERIVFWGPNTNTNIIRVPKNDRIRIRILFGFPKLTEYEYEYYSVWKNHPNTNTNIIRFENINRIRIRIFWYSNIIRIIFEYRIIRSPLALKPVKAHYCAQRQNIKEYKRTIYFQKVQTGCIFYWSPPNTFQVLWSGW